METINIVDENKQTMPMEDLEHQLAEAREAYIRLAADFENHRKRTAREIEGRAARQKEALASDLLPVIDNLERALTRGSGANLQQGVELILKQMVETLGRHGFKPREDLGQPFDGRFHDALAVACKPAMPDHSVVEVWERGWMRGEQMFRPAKVLVNKLDAETAPPNGTEPQPFQN